MFKFGCLALVVIFWVLGAQASEHGVEYIDLGASEVQPVAAGPNGITKQEFIRILRRVVFQHEDYISRLHGKRIDIAFDWNGDPRTKAGEEADRVSITISGSLVKRLPNEESVVFVICHELGHLAGGSPQDGSLSAEGQADYFAASKCFKRYYLSQKFMDMSSSARERFLEHSDKAILQFFHAIPDLAGVDEHPSLDSFDSKNVPWTELSYPSMQCRLDTVRAGLRCDVDENIMFSADDPNVGACNGAKAGARPACWYRPFDGSNFPLHLSFGKLIEGFRFAEGFFSNLDEETLPSISNTPIELRSGFSPEAIQSKPVFFQDGKALMNLSIGTFDRPVCAVFAVHRREQPLKWAQINTNQLLYPLPKVESSKLGPYVRTSVFVGTSERLIQLEIHCYKKGEVIGLRNFDEVFGDIGMRLEGLMTQSHSKPRSSGTPASVLHLWSQLEH